MILRLEYDPTVLHYQEQPRVLYYYTQSGDVRRYIPDFEVTWAHGNGLVEVKPGEQMAKPQVRAKYAAIAVRMRERNLPFRIFTERMIRREPHFSNICRIHDSVRSLNCLDRSPLGDLPKELDATMRMGDLARILGGQRILFRHFLAGNIHFDMMLPMTDKTVIAITRGAQSCVGADPILTTCAD